MPHILHIRSNHNLDQDYIRISQQDDSPHHIDEVGKDIDISPLRKNKDVYAVFVAIIIITLMMVALVVHSPPPSRN